MKGVNIVLSAILNRVQCHCDGGQGSKLGLVKKWSDLYRMIYAGLDDGSKKKKRGNGMGHCTGVITKHE